MPFLKFPSKLIVLAVQVLVNLQLWSEVMLGLMLEK